MSLKFSDTTNKNGIIQRIEKELTFPDGYITGDATRFLQWTADVNATHDDAIAIILPASGRWQFDDTNQTDYPIITTNLISGQRDYSFTTDGSSNLILDIYRVMIADTTGTFHEVSAVDQQSANTVQQNTDSFINGLNSAGVPYRYDKTGNGFFLDPIPNYNSAGGLKVFINREGSYFTTGDTAKKPGIAGLFHEYYVVNPAYKYASMKLSVDVVTSLFNRKTMLEMAIANYYGNREKDAPRRMIPNRDSNK